MTGPAEIPAATRMGAVHLSVSDLDRSLAYYAGTVGLEAYASDGDDERALGRFREAFTLPPEPAAA